MSRRRKDATHRERRGSVEELIGVKKNIGERREQERSKKKRIEYNIRGEKRIEYKGREEKRKAAK